jgi:hypothetical protein
VLESEPLDLRTDEMRWPTRVGSKGRREGEPTDEMRWPTRACWIFYMLPFCIFTW